jgi:hypothetical protein
VNGLRKVLTESASSLGGYATAKDIGSRKYEYGVCYIHETRLGYKSLSIPIFAEAELVHMNAPPMAQINMNCLASGRKKMTGPWYK